MTAKVYKMRFVVFHHICRSDSGRLPPGEIHFSMYGAKRQPRFENQQHAAVKKKTRTSQPNYHGHQVVMWTAGYDGHHPDGHAGGYKHAGSKVKGHHRTLQNARATGQFI